MMNGTRLEILLDELARVAPAIAPEVHWWAQEKLLPLLDEIAAHELFYADECEADATRLAEVLKSRPETAGVVLALKSVGGHERALKPVPDLPNQVPLPDRVKNECVGRIRVIKQHFQAAQDKKKPVATATRK